MNRTQSSFTKFASGALALAVAAATTACGGSQEPAESPEAAPAAPAEPESAPPADTTGTEAPAGEHTMPDGTKMKGHEHGDAAEGEHKH
jgi:hypothetical protein